jgi:hypothetical protein
MVNELTAVVHQTQQLREEVLPKCEGLPTELTNVMLSKFSINGAIPLTMDNMREMLTTVVSQLRAEMREAVDSVAQSHIPPSLDSRFETWNWKGRFHMVPPGWILPSSINVKDMWHLWHFGHLADRIAPLRGLKKFDLSCPSQVTLWSKTKQIMEAICHAQLSYPIPFG